MNISFDRIDRFIGIIEEVNGILRAEENILAISIMNNSPEMKGRFIILIASMFSSACNIASRREHTGYKYNESSFHFGAIIHYTYSQYVLFGSQYSVYFFNNAYKAIYSIKTYIHKVYFAILNFVK